MDFVRVSAAIMILALLGTAGLFAHTLWSLTGPHFWMGMGVSATIAGIALYGASDLIRYRR